jgi:hypothetical protein
MIRVRVAPSSRSRRRRRYSSPDRLEQLFRVALGGWREADGEGAHDGGAAREVHLELAEDDREDAPVERVAEHADSLRER